MLAVLAFGGPAAVLSQPVFERACEGLRASQARDFVATGMAPLTEWLRALRQLGIVSVNYLTDDPWNPAMRSSWYLRALPLYDLVFTPRRSNLEDFQRLGCPKVHYLPFGYDETLFASPVQCGDTPAHDVLLIGAPMPTGRPF